MIQYNRLMPFIRNGLYEPSRRVEVWISESTTILIFDLFIVGEVLFADINDVPSVKTFLPNKTGNFIFLSESENSIWINLPKSFALVLITNRSSICPLELLIFLLLKSVVVNFLALFSWILDLRYKSKLFLSFDFFDLDP